MRSKRAWRANATDAEPAPDELEEGERVVSLTVRLMTSPTPAEHVGREVFVLLTRPMLERLAQLAEDVGAVQYVEPKERSPEWL